MKPKIGDERYVVEMISTPVVEAMAREQGWDGEDGLREFCEPQDAATYSTHKTLDDATAAARQWLAAGQSFYGSAIIDHEIFTKPHDDAGRLIPAPAEWERAHTYEVAMDGEAIEVDG
jgi:hypothetical protein